MTKPQFAPEPSMEDILASIRKMISDDRAPPHPLPDPMTRKPFSEASSPGPTEAAGRWEGDPPASAARPAPSYGSLSEAIKAAGQPSDQRRTLEERISDLLDKGSVGSVDSLASVANRASTVSPAAPSRPAAPVEPTQRGSQGLPVQGATPGSAGHALPFGTRAPAPERGSAPGAAPAKPAPAGEPKAEVQRVIAMPSRYPTAPATSPSAPAASGAALNGQSHGTSVGSFGSRVAATAAQPAKEPVPQSVPRAEAPAAERSVPAEPLQAPELAPGDVVRAAIGEQASALTAGAPSEALVDAMIELVTKEPASLSVFTSGTAFMKGVSAKGIGVEKSVAAHKADAAAHRRGTAASADDGPAPQLDGAAAELLRPMLRQWLAENMPRIVEAALRSELTSGGRGPGKA